MQLLNETGIETAHGFRTFELYEGDITDMDEPVDVLILSAKDHSYYPTPGTVIQALRDRHGIVVKEEVAHPDLDLREALGCWISRPLENECYGRLICAEVTFDLKQWAYSEQSVRRMVDGAFLALTLLEEQDVVVRSVAMPILGAGTLQIDPDAVLRFLVPRALRQMRRSRHLQRVRFVEKNHERAMLLDEAMNRLLGSVCVPSNGSSAGQYRSRILEHIEVIRHRGAPGTDQFLQDLETTIEKHHVRSQEVGLLGRRLVEVVCSILVGVEGDLHKRIVAMNHMGVAPWVISYLHLLRTFGNVAAHPAENGTYSPDRMEAHDVELAIAGIERVLHFWAEDPRFQLA